MTNHKDRVAYKPLGYPTGRQVDGADLELVGHDMEANETEFEPLEQAQPFHLAASDKHQPHSYASEYSALPFGLRHLRLILYLAAVLLFLIFIAQLTTTDRNQTGHPRAPTSARYVSQRDNNIAASSASNNEVGRPTSGPSTHSAPLNSFPQLADKRPLYSSYLASVASQKNSHNTHTISSQDPLDDLQFPIDDRTTRSSPSSSPFAGHYYPTTIWWLLNLRDTDKYVTVTNYIRAIKSFSYNASVTLTTQATTEFLHHSLELCTRWDGPISLAVFSPGGAMTVAVTLIKFMRQCLPEPLSACIRDKITWHLVYNRFHGPHASSLGYPKDHLDSKNFPLFVEQEFCPKLAGPEPADLIRQFEAELRRVNNLAPANYRQQFHLTYPINVLRNTARLAATTKYLLASDIELYPSTNLVPQFVNYISRHDVTSEYIYIRRFIFALPIFEVKSNVSAPKTKEELVKLFERGDAVFFHKYVCDPCQAFPNRIDWLQRDVYNQTQTEDPEQQSATPSTADEESVIFEVTQRNKSRDSWEPIFIGTNDDPSYDDRLSWDGRRDKMGQMYEMCLQDYYILVFGNAFLVHAPGIKHIDKTDVARRISYIRQNNAIYDSTMSNLRQKYLASSNKDKC